MSTTENEFLCAKGLVYDCRFMERSYIMVLFCGLFTTGFTGYELGPRSETKLVQTLCTVCAAVCFVIYILFLIGGSFTVYPAYNEFQDGMEACSRNTTTYCEFEECKKPLITCAVVDISFDWFYGLGLISWGCYKKRNSTVSTG